MEEEKCYEGYIDIYSGEIGRLIEADYQFSSGAKPHVEDSGSALRVVCVAASKEAAQEIVRAERDRFCATPMSRLDREYGRKPLGQRQQ